MTTLPYLLEAAVLHPGDRLFLLLGPDATKVETEGLAAFLRERGFGDEVIVIGGDVQMAVQRAAKAEGSTVGQCGDSCPPVFFATLGETVVPAGTHTCHLAHGHTGLHSDGEATWTSVEAMTTPTQPTGDDDLTGGGDQIIAAH